MPKGVKQPRRVGEVFAERLEMVRTARGLTQAGLAERVSELGFEVDRSVIANIENGRRERVTVEELFAFAAALNVGPTDLLLPSDDEPIAVTALVEEPSSGVRRWLVGEAPPARFLSDKWSDQTRGYLEHYAFAPGLTQVQVLTATDPAVRALTDLDVLLRTAIVTHRRLRSDQEADLKTRLKKAFDEAVTVVGARLASFDVKARDDALVRELVRQVASHPAEEPAQQSPKPGKPGPEKKARTRRPKGKR